MIDLRSKYIVMSMFMRNIVKIPVNNTNFQARLNTITAHYFDQLLFI